MVRNEKIIHIYYITILKAAKFIDFNLMDINII